MNMLHRIKIILASRDADTLVRRGAGEAAERTGVSALLMKQWHSLQKTRGPVPEAPKKLAGGGARNERNHRNPKKWSTRPEGGARSGPGRDAETPVRAGTPGGQECPPHVGISGAASGAHSIVVSFRWFRSFLASPPAKFRCASGAFSNDDRAGYSVANARYSVELALAGHWALLLLAK